MRFTTTLFIFFLYSLTVNGQEAENSPEELAFDEAFDYYQDEEYDSAIVMFRSFLADFPNSALVPRAKYNIGYLLIELDRAEESIPVFEDLLAADYNEKDPAGGLMEQYTLYKHRSASHLADIYLNAEDYDKAAKYIRLFDKKYKYQHFCGNEMMSEKIRTAQTYARLYAGQGKPDKAIDQLLPYLFFNGLASNYSLLEQLHEILKQRYSEEELKAQVELARSSLEIQDEDKATIKFLGSKIEVHSFQLYAFNNPEMEENMNLKEEEKWLKVFDTNPVFEPYVN